MAGRRLGVEAALVDGAWIQGDVEVADGIVERVGLPSARRGRRALPGFVDLQVNGFAGTSFGSCDRAEFERAAVAIARHGVTSFLPTITTMPLDRYQCALAVMADVISHPTSGARAVGVHLEGPFLSSHRPGAHNPQWLVAPDVEAACRMCDAAPIALMTVAPELDGADLLIAQLRARGVVVSAGHTDARADQAHAAFDRGVSMVTHLWNAQRQITSREPGLAGVALARDDVYVGLIADGVHLAPETVLVSMAAAGRRAVVVTDAAVVAGLADGDHLQYGHRVTISDGAVRLPDGTLSGSALGLDHALRNLVGWGVDIVAAVAAMTTSPAVALGRSDIGRLVAGGPADVVVVDEALTIEQVFVGGTEIEVVDE
jgi:N-acetylglucosamine-6-phosphate deacetylase